jgi:hypothetical protein
MWLFTRYGFFSATVSRYDPTKIQVRARAREDLEKLVEFARGEHKIEKLNLKDPISDILELDHADYRYRVLMPRKTWSKLAFKLADDIYYSNFKNEIHDRQRHDLYLRVWSTMLSLQESRYSDPIQYQLFGDYGRVDPETGELIDTDYKTMLDRDPFDINPEHPEELVDLRGEESDPTDPFYDPLRNGG